MAKEKCSKYFFTKKINGYHGLGWTTLNVFSTVVDHGNVEGSKNDEAATEPSLFAVVVQGTESATSQGLLGARSGCSRHDEITIPQQVTLL